jgi:hypothetical protein
MSDDDAGEIFSLARDSFRGGQTSFQIEALPFRMTAQNLARHHDDPNMPFWRTLKVASDEFDLTLRPPKVDVCDRHYVFNADANGAAFDASGKCPAYTVADALTAALAQKQAADDASVAQAVAAIEDAKKQAAEHALAVEQEQQQPSLLDRLVKRADTASVPVPPASTAPATPTPSAKLVAAVPEPRLRPQPKSTAADAAPATPTVGKLVKKKFLWPGDDDQSATSGQSL